MWRRAPHFRPFFGDPPLTSGTQLSGLPSKLAVATTITVPAYFTIPNGATWQSIANTLYGANSPEGGEALRDALNDPPLTPGTRLTNLPATLSVTTPDTLSYDLDAGELTLESGTWAAPGLLETSGVDAGSPRIAFDAFGNGLALWRSGDDLYSRYYERATGTWLPEVVIVDSNPNLVHSPALAVDANGIFMAAWAQSDGEAVSAYLSLYIPGADEWSEPFPISGFIPGEVSTTEGSVVAAIDFTGQHLTVGWQHTNGDLVVIHTGSNPPWQIVETGSSAAAEPNLVLDSSGNVLVLGVRASRRPRASRPIRCRNRNLERSAASGELVDGGGSAATDARWSGQRDGGLGAGFRRRCATIDFATATWDTAQTIHSGSGLPDAAVVSADEAGNVVAVWQQSDGTADSVWASTFDVATLSWSTPQLLETSNNAVPSDIRSVTTAMVDGRIVAAWLQSDGTRISLLCFRVHRRQLVDADTAGAEQHRRRGPAGCSDR